MDSDSPTAAWTVGHDGEDSERTVLVSAPVALAAGARLGDYDLVSVIGQGGFGIVYLAWDRVLECRFAIKEYMPSSIATRGGDSRVSLKSASDREVFEIGLRSFVNEAQLLAGFDHPSLVKVYRFWQANGTAYMLMPYYEGPTLKEALEAAAKPFGEAWLLALLDPITDALRVLHASQCYHRDISPDNVKLRADTGVPVLLDFGAARRMIGDMRRNLTAIYKPGYAPLEQREDSGIEQGPWTDVYALAAVLHLAIAGVLPPSPLARLEVDVYIPLGRRVRGDFSERFLGTVDRALAVRPADRTRSMAQFRSELGLDVAPAPRVESPFRYPHGDPRSRGLSRPARRRAVIALAGASLAVAAGAGWRYRVALASVQAAPPLPQPSASPPPHPPAAASEALNRMAPAPAPADPIEAFDRIAAAATPGFAVGVHVRKTPLRVDRDPLDVTVDSTRDGYVHVLLLDADGSMLMLFPNTETPLLPIRRGATLQLPRLMSRKPTGVERLLAIVSQRPRDFGERGQREGIFMRLSIGGDRGAAAATPDAGRPVCAEARSCAGPYGAARFDVEVVP